MSRLLRADFYHMYCKKWIWLCVLSMMFIAVGFCIMQYTAMDYEVGLDRVIFLPMSFYGVAIAALISILVGEDFSEGIVKNKIISGRTRVSIYFSNLVVSWAACITVYLLTVATAWGIGVNFFEVNVTISEIMRFVVLGCFTCLSYGSIYCMITISAGNKTIAVAICMSLAFVMLFLCLHSNSILVQTEYKDGIWNPHYVVGIKRLVYELLHDINPSGQAAQLSEMKCLNPVRFIAADLIMMVVTGVGGVLFFYKKDIR